MGISHRPSGSMCKVCTRFFLNCSELKFSAMPKMKTDKDGTIVVKCIEFIKVKKMNELFNRIIAWRQNNLPAGLPYEPLPQIGFLNKELNEAIDEFIAGNIDKAVGEITDIMIYSLGAVELLNGNFDKNFHFLENKHNQLTDIVTAILHRIGYISSVLKFNRGYIIGGYENLIAECINCIESLGYNSELALLETIKKIESRRGAWNPETRQWEKEKNQADVYVPDYFKAKIKKDGDR